MLHVWFLHTDLVKDILYGSKWNILHFVFGIYVCWMMRLLCLAFLLLCRKSARSILPNPTILEEVSVVDYHWRELPQVSFLSRQKYACRNKTFVATKLCLSRQNIFVATNICCEKHVFVATNILLSPQKTCLSTNTCFLSRQKWYLWQLPPVIVDMCRVVLQRRAWAEADGDGKVTRVDFRHSALSLLPFPIGSLALGSSLEIRGRELESSSREFQHSCLCGVWGVIIIAINIVIVVVDVVVVVVVIVIIIIIIITITISSSRSCPRILSVQ